MSDFDGTLNPSAGWPDVPQASDVMRLLGGEGGPLNAQAEALAARTNMLHANVSEALRRSYVEAGYNVVGTFREGFTYVNANDVGIDEATGKGFTGPAGPVAAGTDPASGGFVDVSRYVDSDFIPVNLLHNTAGITKVYSDGKWFAWDNPTGTLISFTNNHDYGTATMVCDVSGEIKEFEFVTADVAALRSAPDGTYLSGFGIDGEDLSSDSTQKFHRACKYAESSGRTLRSNPWTVFKISELPPAITTNGFSADLSGAEVVVDTLTSVRGSAVFSFAGTVDNSIKATLTGDSYDSSFPVNDASVFKVGDYVVGKYTVKQDVKVVPTSNMDYEFLSQIVAINGNVVKVATSRYYKLYSSPSGGGGFELIKALPVTDFSVSNVRKRDTVRGGVNTDHALASTYLCAGYVFENLYNSVSNGTSVYHRISHNYRTTRTQNRFPTRTDAGRGYTEQHIACTNGRIENPTGIAVRHVVDFANFSADMDVIGGRADTCKSYGFGTHGGWESNIRFNGQKGRSCGMFIFAGSGEEFGQHSANISVINPDGVGCEYLVLALTNGAKVANLEIKNPTYKYHTSTYSYAVEASMDEVSIGGSGVIDGGVKLIPTQRDSFGTQKDIPISDVEIGPRSDNDVCLDISNVLNYEVRLSNCDLYGKIKQSSSNLSISFNDCGLNPPTTGLFDTSGRVTNRVSIKGGKVNLKGNTTDTTLNIKEFTYSGVDLESNNFTWNIMMTNPAGGGVFSLRDIQNPPAFDITGVSARISLTSFENGKIFVPSVPMLKLKGSNNRLTISSGIIVDSESTQIVIDPTCVNTNLILTSVTHSQPFALGGTYRGGVASGNVLLSGTQSIPTPLVLGANVGYTQV